MTPSPTSPLARHLRPRGVAPAARWAACLLSMFDLCTTQCEPLAFRTDWQRTLGGRGHDYLGSVDWLTSFIQTRDGSFVCGGFSSSPPSGTKTAPAFGKYDFWIAALNPDGTPSWDRAFGGTGDDRLFDCAETEHGDLLLAGQSDSPGNGTKTSPLRGGNDGWVLAMDRAGSNVWDKSFGGAGNDAFLSCAISPEGGCALAGYSDSTPSESKISAHFGDLDVWIVRINDRGTRIWERSLGGANRDTAQAILSVLEGGWIVAATSESDPGGNKTSPHFGRSDFWLLRLDSLGNKLWDRSYGGAGNDSLTALLPVPGGGWLLGGWCESGISGNKTRPGFGGADFWIVRVDREGNILWQETYGGADNDTLESMTLATEGGFILAGASSSRPGLGKVAPHYGLLDFWVIRVDGMGQKIWEYSQGGSNRDVASKVLQLADNGLVVAGSSESDTGPGKESRNLGGPDFWVLKIPPEIASGAPRLSAPRPGFEFQLEGWINRLYVVESSGDLNNWVPFSTNLLRLPKLQVADPGADALGHRFYRARLADDRK